MHSSTAESFQDEFADSLPSGTEDLVAQLSYIKTHQRYQVTGKKLKYVLYALTMLPLPLMFISTGWRNMRGDHAFNIWIAAMLLWLCVPFASAIVRYWQEIMFARVRTEKSSPENEEQLLSFFKANDLSYHKHPQVDGLYWILSKPVYWKSKKREVVFFILDDEQILIQGNFTGTEKRYLTEFTRHRQVARALRSWFLNKKSIKDIWAWY